VRDIFTIKSSVSGGEQLVIVTSDRFSAFDRVLTTIPCKGEVLNRISLFWFEQTRDIVPNHILKPVYARSVLVNKNQVLPIEVVVRGYLTGSAWRDYQAGKSISGIKLPQGLRFNERFREPLFTPTTKETAGHDRPISKEDIVKEGLLSARILEKVEKTALALFKRGTELLARQGLILVDTKYEFGLAGDELYLIDEVHTPDSSRFWYADTYEALFARGEKQRELDKEYLRRWLMEERNYMGDGPIPEIPDEIRIDVAERYIKAYELITGETFEAHSRDKAGEEAAVFQALSEA
jgi:phosphoribosylaminoimidazole-succinocarboxamide synthase